MSRPSDELLALARSESYEDRCGAATELAGYETPDAADALLDLLCDSRDTAPIQAAAQALLARRDTFGAKLIFRGIALGDDDAADHLIYFVQRDSGSIDDYAIWDFAKASLDADDADVRDGAAEPLDSVHLGPERP